MLYFWQRPILTEYQRDELWNFVHTKEENLASAKLLCEIYGDARVLIAFAFVRRLVMTFAGGKRAQENATLLFRSVKVVSDPGIPFFTIAGLRSRLSRGARASIWPKSCAKAPYSPFK